MRIAGLVFAATFAGLGLWGLIGREFAAIWQPVPKHWPAREALMWATGLVALGCGLGLLWKRTAAAAAGVLAAVLLAWLLVFKARVAVAAPGVAVVWENCGETAVLTAAAWVLFATSGVRAPIVGGDTGVRLARILYGLAMIAFGVAHMAYAKETAALVPRWLPGHVTWAWATGAAYVAAGAAILVGAWARLAATLSAVQMGLFTLLVWAPVVARGHVSAGDWNETAVSWSLTAAGCVVAASYASAPWFAAKGLAVRGFVLGGPALAGRRAKRA